MSLRTGVTSVASRTTAVRRRRIRTRHLHAYLFMLPAVLLLIGLTFWPLARTFWLSIQNVNLVRPGSEFIGLANFRDALTADELFWPAVWHSVLWTFGSVTGEYLLGLGSAVLLNQPLRGQRFYRMLVLIPWTVPIVIAAMTWRWILQPEFGIANIMLVRFDLISAPRYWLGDVQTALGSVIFVNIWRSFPFYTITLLAAMQSVPKELLEAASIDGAKPWQRFWHITMPHLKAVSIAIIAMHIIWTFNNVDFIWLMTEGGPLHSSETLATLVYRMAFRTYQVSRAAALSVLMIGTLVATGVIYLAMQRWFGRD